MVDEAILPKNSVASGLSKDIPTLMAPALLLAIGGLSPFGVLAVLRARKARTYLNSGDEAAALALIDGTRRLIKTGFYVAISLYVLLIIAQVVVTM